VSLIFTPGGGAIETERPEMHWPVEFMRMLAIFAANCEAGQLGIRCERCKQPLQGHNAKADNFWHMECACRRYLGRNPLSTAVKKANDRAVSMS
jgi:hypothetical protein